MRKFIKKMGFDFHRNCALPNKIETLYFEFNEMNIISHAFFRDIYEILNKYNFYRMLPDGLAPLGEYSPIRYEIFAYQNIVAIKK